MCEKPDTLHNSILSFWMWLHDLICTSRSDRPKPHLSLPLSLSLSLSLSLCYFHTDKTQRTVQWKRYFTGQTFIHTPSCSSTKLLFHQAFVHFSADGCFNRGSRELGDGGEEEGGCLRWVFIYPSKRNRCLSCCRRSAWINGRFQKAPVKNQCPLHAIDGCLATE